MFNPLDPLLTWRTESPDFNAADNQREIEFLFARQQAIDGMLAGTVPPDVVLDLLEFQGLNPIEYADRAIANMDRAIAQNMEPDPDEVALYFPCF